jgi:hypothetical protein
MNSCRVAYGNRQNALICFANLVFGSSFLALKGFSDIAIFCSLFNFDYRAGTSPGTSRENRSLFPQLAYQHFFLEIRGQLCNLQHGK